MTPRFLLPTLNLLLVTPALADPRITTHFYQQSEVVPLHGRVDIQSMVAFAPEERIENIAVGDSASWQAMPNKRADLLFLKPLKPGARTNMTIVTDRRTYLFDLVASGSQAQPAVYMLQFTYPAPPPKPVAASPVIVAQAPPTPAAPDVASLEFGWSTKGDKTLLPQRIFDDGHSVYIAWPKASSLPAILSQEAKGVEGPVNYTTRGDYVVVDGVPGQLVLRSGKRVAMLTRSSEPATDSPRAQSPKSSGPLPSKARIASRLP